MKAYFQKYTSAAPLAFFRIALGLLLLASIIRFWINGWIDELYVQPKYFFSFYGFEFISPLGQYTYILFFICGASALLVALGCFYRVASVSLFLSFTYIELIDKSTYLNHYYFISMVCLLMIFLPAHTYFSIDAYRSNKLRANEIPQWCIDVLKGFICLVYIFAGLAKVNSDWLLHAQPLKIWLPAKNDLPVIGGLFNYDWIPYAFSWAGCLYDLCIPFLLIRNSTRWFAYCMVVVFHILTAILFPIGMFPYIMIITALIFFPASLHQQFLVFIGNLNLPLEIFKAQQRYSFSKWKERTVLVIFTLFFFAQILLPLRFLLYPGNLFWTEQGYRFSWRVMLMEKAGFAEFTVIDPSGKKVKVNNAEFLTPLQEKMMATQPDMILQYAHLLKKHYTSLGFENPKVYVDSYVSLNGRLGRPLVSADVNLASIEDSFAPKNWLMQ